MRNKRLILLVGVAALCLQAQQPGAAVSPAFEVASVKRAAGGGPPGDIPRNMDNSPGHFAMRNAPLRYCLEWAYNLQDYEISGPDWIKSDERYDIIAIAPGPASNDEMRLMLQRLLTERFQMKLHWEKRELSVYALVLGKGSPKLKAAASDGQPELSGGASGAFFHNQPLSRLTFLLTRRLDRPVLNLTGLTGIYDFTLDISGLPTGVTQAGDNPGPSIFTTVQQDLGLKLEAQRASIDILIIDHVEKVPTEN